MPALGGHFEDLRVGVIRSGDDESVDFGVVHDLLVVAVDLRGRSLPFLGQRLRLLPGVVPDVANRREAGVETLVMLEELSHDAPAAAAGTGDADPDLAVYVPGFGYGGKSGQCESGSGAGRMGQEGTPVDGRLTHGSYSVRFDRRVPVVGTDWTMVAKWVEPDKVGTIPKRRH